MKVIEVSNLSKSFRIPSARRDTLREHFFGMLKPRRFETLRVLDAISFDVEKGESLGIMGRNGSGKSTLLKILSGIYAPDSGTVRVHAPLTPILELGIGWNGELTARDNIFLTGTAMGLSLREIHAQLDEILQFAEVERFVDLELKHFSSGMSARLAYAIAFRAVREVLILDEIFAVGDAAFKEKCHRRYHELSEAGRTVLLVSHSPTVISKFCRRAILIEGGRVVLDGPPDEVATAYEKLLGAAA
jgi:ABC-type polysaccharide/polyol phosphate transport system ATPase subunit